MSNWFGKHNKEGYALFNNGKGSSSDHIQRKKNEQLYSFLYNQTQVEPFVSDYTQMNVKNEGTVIVNEDFVVTHTKNHELLYQLKQGQSETCYDCNEEETPEEIDTNFFINSNTLLFDPEKENCKPQTYINDNETQPATDIITNENIVFNTQIRLDGKFPVDC